MGTTTTTPSALMSTKQVADFLGYRHVKSVTELMNKGHLRPRYLPNTCRPKFMREEVEALISDTPYEPRMGFQKRKDN